MTCLTSAWALHEPELRGWVRHRLGNAQDVEDLLQDLFLKALRQGERFCSVQNARAWLFEVARNTFASMASCFQHEYEGSAKSKILPK
jgi:RNA polymerase sigma-70 factor (ECF subfamily)